MTSEYICVFDNSSSTNIYLQPGRFFFEQKCYGTLICCLEKHKKVSYYRDFLRGASTLVSWLCCVTARAWNDYFVIKAFLGQWVGCLLLNFSFKKILCSWPCVPPLCRGEKAHCFQLRASYSKERPSQKSQGTEGRWPFYQVSPGSWQGKGDAISNAFPSYCFPETMVVTLTGF